MKRRDFLKTGGVAGTAGLILDGCGKPQQIIPLLISDDRFVPGEEGWVRTVCQQCSAGCGITVRVMQGESIRTIEGQQKRVKAVQAKKIEGNPEHPISMGGTCARGQAGVQALYHPDRIQTPLKLLGPRGSGQYQPLSWKEAQQLLVTSLQQQQATPQAIALMSGRRNRGTMGTIIERFAAGLGTTNVVSYDPFDPAPIRKAMELVTGISRLPAVDFANARYLLSLNANLFETFLSPVRHIYSYGQFRQGHPGQRGKFVHAEPRLSQTAACADEWLPIKPGTEGLLALALAHVIVNEKLYDADFVNQSTNGFAAWSATLASYAPDKIAAEIDVPAASIQRVAREFAERRPSVAVGDSRDVASLTAIYALNALVGAYGRPGGMLFGQDDASGPVPATGSKPPVSGDKPVAGAQQPEVDIHTLTANMGREQIKALLVFDSNPLFTLPEAETLRSALVKVPFIASFASFLDETSVMADLILPSHVTLERWVDDVPEPGVGFPVRTIGQPVVEPRWDTRDPGDVLIETAKALGGKASEALPFENMAAAVKESFRSVHALQAGSSVDADFDAFFRKVTASGGWWGAPREASGLKAEGSARAEGLGPKAQSPEPRAAVRINFVVPAQPVAARAFAGDAAKMPFLLYIYPSAAFADGRTAHLPWLQEMPDPMTTVMWGSWVEINPETAHKLEIHEGDILSINSPHGIVELPAFLYPGLRPDVIAIPAGQGHTQFGRYAQHRGGNPLRISQSSLDSASGAVLQTGVRVSATKTGRYERLIRFGASDARPHHEHHLHR